MITQTVERRFVRLVDTQGSYPDEMAWVQRIEDLHGTIFIHLGRRSKGLTTVLLSTGTYNGLRYEVLQDDIDALGAEIAKGWKPDVAWPEVTT